MPCKITFFWEFWRWCYLRLQRRKQGGRAAAPVVTVTAAEQREVKDWDEYTVASRLGHG
jgi:hypothetical protein